ncbi:GDSL-type esterase/lipase family protein [Ohessyouella blattaphilus]|uniref:GDSL-type esterase/lipase family protein n=1 Tax=Ohessyouella blattaphilus TaxID=2949333 RepID=A0ABT1EDZ8_9FIRM|nr:GDSL-type esterase/lipase family protein [Ohessyouella blattaphilus]MCP1108924.1 GDSL-type esterase/lipase family protein [Ohessyouella blattaphilus]MCR8562318.1 GDSL-type esterase/lipase family protein [Ohessyouella blattaphilus]MDL2249025.1 GDSL-type esterase/lipase family protein [Lachnospiraceae bacterium OttesenSCG-928-J05]
MKIVCLGDSLTYGYGVLRNQVWTAQLNRSCQDHLFINRGISGDTTGGMLARMDADVLSEAPEYVLLMGGSNDIFLTGDFLLAKCNISSMVFQALSKGLHPLLGIPIPVCKERLTSNWKIVIGDNNVNDKINRYRTWLLEFGEQYYVEIIDFYDAVIACESEAAELYLDGLHLNQKGQSLMTACVTKSMCSWGARKVGSSEERESTI